METIKMYRDHETNEFLNTKQYVKRIDEIHDCYVEDAAAQRGYEDSEDMCFCEYVEPYYTPMELFYMDSDEREDVMTGARSEMLADLDKDFKAYLDERFEEGLAVVGSLPKDTEVADVLMELMSM